MRRWHPQVSFVNDAYFGRILGGVGRTANLWVRIAPGASQESLKEELEAKFEQAGLSVVYLRTTREERSSLEFHFSIMIIPLGLAALMLALIGGLGLSRTMSTNIMERSREVGVMRAIGASDGGIQRIFMIEGLVISLISWFFSLAAAVPFTWLLDTMVGNGFLYEPLAYIFSVSGALIWLVIMLVTAALSCYVPARNASQTSVRQLLAYE